MFPIKCEFKNSDTVIKCMLLSFELINMWDKEKEGYVDAYLVLLCDIETGKLFRRISDEIIITDERIIKKED